MEEKANEPDCDEETLRDKVIFEESIKKNSFNYFLILLYKHFVD